jgi:hypothetical protein
MDKVDKYSFVLLSNCSQPSAESREMTDKKTPNLKALEADLEQEIQAFENSAIRIGEILAEIKDSGVWKTEANYSTFKAYYKAYYKARWEDRLGRAYRTAQNYIEGAKALSAMKEISPHVGDFPKDTAINVARKLGEIEDPSERSRLWREVSDDAEAVERTPTLEDVEQAMAKRAKRDQKLDEWKERFRKRDERE